MATPHSMLIPKDPPSYDSLYLTIPSSSTSQHDALPLNSSCCNSVRGFFRRRVAFFQRLAAATFVAATISATVMLLLWQLQNLTSIDDQDDPWFDPDNLSSWSHGHNHTV